MKYLPKQTKAYDLQKCAIPCKLKVFYYIY